MRRVLLLPAFLALLNPGVGLADEGMWLVNLISRVNMDRMKGYGLELTAEDIYSVNNASLKDAIVALDRGACTGEFMSDRGLIFTNHHCAYDDIQRLTSSERNYLENGFWAYTPEQEIPIQGKTASILVKAEDITERVNAAIEQEKAQGKFGPFSMRRIYGSIERAESEKTGLEASVSSLFKGNRFYIFYYKVFRDVRLVGAPPVSIGAYGGDTDNWMWPQHKGDFAMYRVYADEKGEPADYSTGNKPYKPAKFLTISLKGVEDGDFAMVMGYPFSTNRYISSYGAEERMNVLNPALINVRSRKLGIMQDAMNLNDTLRMKYAYKFFSAGNYYKYAVGENRCLKLFGVVPFKKRDERVFTEWVAKDPQRTRQYGAALDSLKGLYAAIADFQNTDKYYQEAMINGSDLLRFSLRSKALKSALEKKGETGDPFDMLRKAAVAHFKDYDWATDRRMFASAIQCFYENVNPAHVSRELKMLVAKFRGSYDKLAAYVYAKSLFATPQRLDAFIRRPSPRVLQNDPIYLITNSTLDVIFELRRQNEKAEAAIREQERLLLRGVMEMRGEESLYPDASSTMRLTYGTVGGFSPRDGVLYMSHTTHRGYLQKEDSTSYDFRVAPGFRQLLRGGAFGPYADANGNLRIGFITNNDITGGNSGSPVLNSKGQMVGLAYDGNCESMAGDIYFLPEVNKTVCVDIRYVLFVIDRFAGAKNILDELTIVS